MHKLICVIEIWIFSVHELGGVVENNHFSKRNRVPHDCMGAMLLKGCNFRENRYVENNLKLNKPVVLFKNTFWTSRYHVRAWEREQ